MKQFILGLSIGVTLWGFVACGVPDHWHPTTDIKQVDNNNAGVCQCEKLTLEFKEIDIECKKEVDFRGNNATVVPGVDLEKVLSSTLRSEFNGELTVGYAGLHKISGGRVVYPCSLIGRKYKVRLVLKK